MVIESVRTGNRLKNERVVLLKEKSGERYLPIYVGSSYADTLTKVLVGEQCPKPLCDDPSLVEIGRLLSLADSASLVIERSEGNIFHTKFLVAWRGKFYHIDCPCAKALAFGVRAGAPILTEEAVLDKAAVAVRD